LQDEYNKTVYIEDNNFVSLCVEDADVSSIGEISSDCNEANEIDMTDCLGNSTGYLANGINCVDEGERIRIENLQHSAIVGVPAVVEEEEASIADIHYSSGGGGSYIREWSGNNSNLILKTFVSPNRTALVKIKEGRNTGLKEIELKAKNWLSGEIYVVAYDEKPDFCSIDYRGAHKVYRVLDFNNTIKDESIDFGRLVVGIEKDWIYSNNISEIKFVRCYPEYEEVKSSFKNETDSEGIYDVYINSFSAYAILGTFEEIGSVSTGHSIVDTFSRFKFKWWYFGIVGLLLVLLIVVKHRFKIAEHFRSKWLRFDINIRVGK
jgi:hypothetical protein